MAFTIKLSSTRFRPFIALSFTRQNGLLTVSPIVSHQNNHQCFHYQTGTNIQRFDIHFISGNNNYKNNNNNIQYHLKELAIHHSASNVSNKISNNDSLSTFSTVINDSGSNENSNSPDNESSKVSKCFD